MPMPDKCICQCVPHITVWQDSVLTPVSDVQLFDRKSDARTAENWSGGNFGTADESCSYWAYDEDAGWHFECRMDTEGGIARLMLSVVDEDKHMLGRHEFKLVQERAGESELKIKATVTAGSGPDEFIITFEGWCRAVPMTLTIEDQDDTADTPATLTQTGPHEWTVVRATKAAASQYKTYLTINGDNNDMVASNVLVILEDVNYDFDDLNTAVNGMKIATDDSGGNFFFGGAYGVFEYEPISFGEDSSIADPSLLYLELRIAGVQNISRSRVFERLLQVTAQIEVIEEPGWYVAGRQGNKENYYVFYRQPNGEFPLTNGEPMSPVPFGDPAYTTSINTIWKVMYRNGQWSVQYGAGNSNRRWWAIFEPVDEAAARLVGLRPGTIEFECVRPWSPYIPQSDGSAEPPFDLDALLIDPVGKRIKLHFEGVENSENDFSAGPANLPSRQLVIDAASMSVIDAIVPVGTDRPPNDVIYPYAPGFGTSDVKHEFSVGTTVPTADLPSGQFASFLLRFLGGGYITGVGEPPPITHVARELVLSYAHSPSFGVVDVDYIDFVPADGRILLDDCYDDPIDWINRDGVGTETVTTSRGWMKPAFCTDYESVQVFAPEIQKVTWKNETFYLRRTDHDRWSNIVETESDGRLMMYLEFVKWSSSAIFHLFADQMGWEFTTYDPDDIGLPHRSIHRFKYSGAQHESEHGERPPFNTWKPQAANTLVLAWHREHAHRMPDTVTVEPIASVSPRGSSDWKWDAAADDWILIADNTLEAAESGNRYVAWKPFDRGVNDGDTQTVDSIKHFTNEGVANVTDEVIWWSPDGVGWVIMIDGVTLVFMPPASPYAPPAPTDPPTGVGDVYRALAIYPADE